MDLIQSREEEEDGVILGSPGEGLCVRFSFFDQAISSPIRGLLENLCPSFY